MISLVATPRARMQGRTAERFRKVIDLGTMSFKLYQPADLKVRPRTRRACCASGAREVL
jgi:hypothetical protein